jgi:signal transduction histidine kinase
MMVRDQSAADQRQYLERVMESAQRIKDIVDDMVSLRHLENGEAQYAPESVVLQDLVQHTIDRIRSTATERRQIIGVQLPEQPLQFACDREKLLLILGHLLSNAVRFTPDDGQILVRAELRPAETLDRDGRYLAPSRIAASLPWVVVEVQDNGIGIAEHEQPRIFDRFYQVASSLTRDHGGTGLGLALVRELVIMLGGAVWVESQHSQGSTFGIALPYRQHIAGVEKH